MWSLKPSLLLLITGAESQVFMIPLIRGPYSSSSSGDSVFPRCLCPSWPVPLHNRPLQIQILSRPWEYPPTTTTTTISTCLLQNNVNSEATAEHPLSEPDYPKTPPLPSLNHVEIWNKSQVTRCAPRGWLQSAAAAPFWGPDLMRQNKQVRAALFVACIRPLKKHSGLWCLDDAAESGDVTSIRWGGSSGRSVLCGSR